MKVGAMKEQFEFRSARCVFPWYGDHLANHGTSDEQFEPHRSGRWFFPCAGVIWQYIEKFDLSNDLPRSSR